MTFKEYEKFYKTNKHLPHFPSAKEIETRGGDLGELVNLQQQTIEEQALYIIQLHKSMEAMNKRIEALENKK